MNHKLIILLVTCITFSSCSRKKVIDIWTNQSLIQEVREYEMELNINFVVLNKYVSLSESMFPLVSKYDFGDPLIIKRSKKNYLPVYAEYYYSRPDSILRYISYNLEIDRYGNYNNKQNIWNLESSKLNEYNLEFEKVKQQLTKEFGKPNEEDSKPQSTKSVHGGPDYLSRNTIWEDESRFMKLNLIFAKNTYRIRLYYYWK